MHTSAPSFPTDARMAELLKAENPKLLIGMVGAKVAVDPEGSLKASTAIDFVAREEFDYTCKEVAEGRPFGSDRGPELPGRLPRASATIPRAPRSPTWMSCRGWRRSTSAT